MKIWNIVPIMWASVCLTHLTSCATGAEPAAMVVESLPSKAPIPGQVRVTTSGGSITLPFWISKISNDDFELAIMDSIRQNHIFKSVPGGPVYTLQADIIELDQPLFAVDLEVFLIVRWTLRDKNQNKIWEKVVRNSYTADFSDAFLGSTRMRLANEGSARGNISKALSQLRQARFKKVSAPSKPSSQALAAVFAHAKP